jgi:hypothetical protein
MAIDRGRTVASDPWGKVALGADVSTLPWNVATVLLRVLNEVVTEGEFSATYPLTPSAGHETKDSR